MENHHNEDSDFRCYLGRDLNEVSQSRDNVKED